MKILLSAAVAAAALLAASQSEAAVRSISRIEFGPPGVLFVADWKSGEVHAVDLAKASTAPARPFNLMDVQGRIEQLLGTRTFKVEDLKARPGSDEIYLAVSYGTAATPAVFVARSDGSIRRLDLSHEAGAPLTLKEAPSGDLAFWGRTPERSLTVSDMRWHDGRLYMAGLSNQTFSSTLRVAPYPFDGGQALTSIAMYHTSHDQMETRAPIRTMAFVTLGGVDYLIAAYMCTPIVAIPVSELRDGAHVTGKTVAELGYGNTPKDMVVYSATDEAGKPTEFLTVTNVNRNAETIPIASLAQAVDGPGLTKAVPWSQVTGVDVIQSPISGALATDNLDPKFFVVARRDPGSGDLQLVTVQKDVKLRLSDFISEYDFPSYSYPPGKQTQYIKPIEDTLMHEEGFTSPDGPAVKRRSGD